MTQQRDRLSDCDDAWHVAVFVALAAAGGVAGLRTLQSPPTLLAIAPSERSVAVDVDDQPRRSGAGAGEPDSAGGGQRRRRRGGRGPGRRVDAAGASRRRCDRCRGARRPC